MLQGGVAGIKVKDLPYILNCLAGNVEIFSVESL